MNFLGGVNFSSRGLWGFVGSPGEYLRFRFLSPFDHPRYLKSGVPTPYPPPPPVAGGCVIRTFFNGLSCYFYFHKI